MVRARHLLVLLLGAAWAQEEDPPVEVLSTGTRELLVGIRFLDPRTGIVAGGRHERGIPAVLMRTADGGRSWTRIDTGLRTRLYDVHFPTSEVGWACGLQGALLRTMDAGSTWTQSSSPFGKDAWLAAIWFVNVRTGFVAGGGQGGVVLGRTRDGGRAWQSLRKGVPEAARTGSLRDVLFVGEKAGFVVGTHGLLLQTTDGGDRWLIRETGTRAWLRSLTFPTTRTGFAGGKAGTLLRTDDGGTTWRRIPFPTKEKINAVAFPTVERGFAATMEGTLWGTRDGGRTWKRRHTGSAHVTALHVPTRGPGWAACGDGTVIRIPPAP